MLTTSLALACVLLADPAPAIAGHTPHHRGSDSPGLRPGLPSHTHVIESREGWATLVDVGPLVRGELRPEDAARAVESTGDYPRLDVYTRFDDGTVVRGIVNRAERRPWCVFTNAEGEPEVLAGLNDGPDRPLRPRSVWPDSDSVPYVGAAEGGLMPSEFGGPGPRVRPEGERVDPWLVPARLAAIEYPDLPPTAVPVSAGEDWLVYVDAPLPAEPPPDRLGVWTAFKGGAPVRGVPRASSVVPAGAVWDADASSWRIETLMIFTVVCAGPGPREAEGEIRAWWREPQAGTASVPVLKPGEAAKIGLPWPPHPDPADTGVPAASAGLAEVASGDGWSAVVAADGPWTLYRTGERRRGIGVPADPEPGEPGPGRERPAEGRSANE